MKLELVVDLAVVRRCCTPNHIFTILCLSEIFKDVLKFALDTNGCVSAFVCLILMYEYVQNVRSGNQ
jgi:uncharacterized membrane protein